MWSQGVSDVARIDRRRWHRVRLTVPVAIRRRASEEGELLSPSAGQATDVSTAGAYVTSRECGAIAPGDVLEVSIVIPEDLRRCFPFSRLVGWCRVVRVDDVGPEKGIALAFCEDRMTLLGAIVFAS